MIGLKELKPDDNIPQITISKDKTTIYLLSTARKTLGDPAYVRLFVDTVGNTVVIALQPASNGYKVQKSGSISVGRKLKKLKIKKGQRSTNYLLIEVPHIGRLHAFFFGEIPDEYKKYAVEPQEQETPEISAPTEAKPTPAVSEPPVTSGVPTGEEEIEIGTPENDYEIEI